jgi:undecaprenyl pyrophosphate phosphatase UppP
MNIGLIILFIGFALAYIVFQLVPLFYFVLTLDEEREKMTIDDWLFFSLLLIVLLIPMAGAIVGLIFKDEDDKWLNRISIISIYIIIIGSVIFFVTV